MGFDAGGRAREVWGGEARPAACGRFEESVGEYLPPLAVDPAWFSGGISVTVAKSKSRPFSPPSSDGEPGDRRAASDARPEHQEAVVREQ